MVQDRVDAESRKSFLDPKAAVARRRSRMQKKSGLGGPGKGTLRRSSVATSGKAPTSSKSAAANEPRRSSVRFLASMAEFDD